MTSPCSVSLNRPATEPGGLGEHGPVRRAAAPAEGAAAAVEQRQPHVVAAGPVASAACASYSVRVAAAGPSVLGGVGVAEHDLEAAPVGGQARRTRRQREHLGEHVGGAACRSATDLEQRDDVERPARRSPQRRARPARTTAARSPADWVKRHDVPRAGVDAEPLLDPGDHADASPAPPRSRSDECPPRDLLQRLWRAPGSAGGPRARPGGSRTVSTCQMSC